jgi:inositol oxygenase
MRYVDLVATGEVKQLENFRSYESASDTVKEFYRLQHTLQTVEFNKHAREAYKPGRQTMSMWDALKKLDTLVDESDPDTQSSQLQHALQVQSYK